MTLPHTHARDIVEPFLPSDRTEVTACLERIQKTILYLKQKKKGEGEGGGFPNWAKKVQLLGLRTHLRTTHLLTTEHELLWRLLSLTPWSNTTSRACFLQPSLFRSLSGIPAHPNAELLLCSYFCLYYCYWTASRGTPSATRGDWALPFLGSFDQTHGGCEI